MKVTTYLHVASTTTINIIVYAATKGRFLWLEGRVRRGVFTNWARRFTYTPARFAEPRSEAEIVQIVKASEKLRAFGSGHSFNDATVSERTLISLDHYSGLVSRDPANRQLTVKGGTRVRDVVKLLAQDGLAFAALPSHDAQSIGGILSTDVHGTGTSWGFISSSVVALKLVDANGDVHVCEPADDLFKAAIGGIGAVGLIIEVTVQGVPRFNVDQRVEMMDIADVKARLDTFLAENDHFSFYMFPFTDQCQVNRWNHTKQEHSRLATIREFCNISLDALLAAWIGNLLAYTRLLPLSRHWSRLSYLVRRGSNLVLESDCAFNRTIYHLHQELEFTVPFQATFDTCERFKTLYEELYPSGLPYTLFEVRFTPSGHDRTLIGAGRDRRSTWIDLVCNDSDGFEAYYAAAEKLIKQIGGRPHLGKYCRAITADDLQRLHGEHFAAFQRLVARHDPAGRFTNAFTRRLIGAPHPHPSPTPDPGRSA